MNEQNIEDIISALYDMVQDARALPLGADKCILERDKVLDMLDEIIAQLPVELKQAQESAAKMVEEEAIYQEAKRQCQEMVLQTQVRMAELRKASNDYMEDALRRTEEAVAMSLEDVRDTRTKFKALVEAQEKRSGVSVQETEE